MAKDRTLRNLILKMKYLMCKKINIDWGTPDWQVDWNNQSYIISQDYMYAGVSYTDNSCVKVEDNSLKLMVKKLETPEYREHWSGNFTCYWKNGWVEFHDKFESPYGTWVFNFIPPVSENSKNRVWPAIWFLREPYSPKELRYKCESSVVTNKGYKLSLIGNIPHEPKINSWVFDINNVYIGKIKNYDSVNKIITIDKKILKNYNEIVIGYDSIIPEVDVMEILDNKFGHTIHYGFDYDKYRKYSIGSLICTPENREYEFAVTITPNKYIFYIDGIKTCEFGNNITKPDDGLCSTQKLYLILNHSINEGIKDGNDVDDFIIKNVRYYNKINF